MHNERAEEIAEARRLESERLVAEGLTAGCQLLPDAILPLADMFCGCGEPGMAWAWVQDYLTQLDPIGISTPSTGSEWLSAYLLHHLGLTEHGVSIRGSWLTDAGREVLAFLREHGPDWSDGKWIGSDGVWRGSMD